MYRLLPVVLVVQHHAHDVVPRPTGIVAFNRLLLMAIVKVHAYVLEVLFARIHADWVDEAPAPRVFLIEALDLLVVLAAALFANKLENRHGRLPHAKAQVVLPDRCWPWKALDHVFASFWVVALGFVREFFQEQLSVTPEQGKICI